SFSRDWSSDVCSSDLASIADLRSAMEQKHATSREIVLQYLTRIAKYEDRINAIITVNPRALEIADSLDRLRAAGRVLGPLHGIQIGSGSCRESVSLSM